MMIDLSALPLSVILPACFLGGLALGYVYFRAMRQTANLIVSQGHPVLGLALTLGRMALLCAGFFLAVQAGAVALLAMLAGVLCAKYLMLRQAQRTEA